MQPLFVQILITEYEVDEFIARLSQLLYIHQHDAGIAVPSIAAAHHEHDFTTLDSLCYIRSIHFSTNSKHPWRRQIEIR